MQAHLDQWKADIDKLRAKAAGASADARLKLEELEAKVDEGKAKLAEVASSSEGAWGSMKGGMHACMQSGWESLKAGFEEAVEELKQ